ncbi:hypothetical protein BH11ARM2_BH11ARM2_19450 [soil metagenome]
MHEDQRATILKRLDHERQTVVYPGVTHIYEPGMVKDIYDGGESCDIAYSSCSESEVDDVIQRQIQAAREANQSLEWKTYGHDRPPCLADRLTAAGFEAGDKEAFMVLLVKGNPEDQPREDIRRITTREGLKDYQTIREEVGGRDCGREIEGYAQMLENHPAYLSIYVAYIEGEPVACGRVYFHEQSQFAALYGGNTRERFRKRGLFTALVATRVREAMGRGIDQVCVDALPTSEPILRKLGFEPLTITQPFTYPF